MGHSGYATYANNKPKVFLSWGTGDDHLYIVQGFVPPPPIL